MTELDVVNKCLRTLGQAPINELTEDSDFISSARAVFAEEVSTCQNRSWWFNTERVQLIPDANSGEVYLPGDAIAVNPARGWVTIGRLPFVQRGRRLYNPSTGSYVFTETLWGQLLRRVSFDEMPFTAQDYVSASAVLSFQSDIDGDTNRYQMLTKKKTDAYSALNSEHIRAIKSNALWSPVTASLLGQVGYGGSGNGWGGELPLPRKIGS